MRADERRSDGPGQRCSKRLLAIADEELPRTKAEEVAAQIHADRSHVRTDRDIGRQYLLKLADQAHGMNGNAGL
jgi:hypothetical protein